MSKRSQFLIRNLIQSRNSASILLAQLREPDIGALCDQDGVWHPCSVRTELLVFVSRIAKDRHLRTADNGGPLLHATFAAAASSLFRCGPSLCGSRVELHPHSQLFFMKNLPGDEQKAFEAVAQQRLPKPANERQLLAKRRGSARSRCSQKVQQADRRTFNGHQGARGEILRKLLCDLSIDRLLGQGLVFEEFLKSLERFVTIRRPEQEHFFECSGPVRHSIGCSGKPLLGSYGTAHHVDARELLNKCQQKGVEFL